MKKNQEYVRRRLVKMKLSGKRKRGRSKRRFLDVMKEGMKKVGAKETNSENRALWRSIIRCSNP